MRCAYATIIGRDSELGRRMEGDSARDRSRAFTVEPCEEAVRALKGKIC